MNLKGKVLSISVNQDVELESVDLLTTAISHKATNQRFSFTMYGGGTSVPISFNDVPMDLEMAKKIATAFENGSDIELTLSVK